MRIVQINATCGIGSTGKICVGISKILTTERIENYVLCSRSNGYSLGIPLSNSQYIKFQALKSRILGNYGFYSKRATRKMIAQLERFQPDVVHLHNIHGHDCHLDMLFTWFRQNGTKLIWTFHDCWAFTGYCTYFDIAKCGKWKHQCFACPKKKCYSLFLDRSSALFLAKKTLFTGLDLSIVTPSHWLSNIVRESFLQQYPVKVVHNGIDLDVFRPCQGDFRRKYELEKKKIILGIALGWDVRKGFDTFISLAKRLPDNYQIVLVGTDSKVDKQLPENIISLHRTQNQQELAEIYSTADVFVNPTREDNFPTVNMEALACGTPVLTYRTGGSPEMLDETCGSVVDCDDIDALEREIVRICTDKPYTKEQCLKKAREFDQTQRFMEYLELYKKVISDK